MPNLPTTLLSQFLPTGSSLLISPAFGSGDIDNKILLSITLMLFLGPSKECQGSDKLKAADY